MDNNSEPQSQDTIAVEAFTIQLTADQKAEYQKAAGRVGLALSAWIASRLDRAVRRESR